MFNSLKLARSTFCLVRSTSEIFGLLAGNIKLNAQNEDCIILIFYFLICNLRIIVLCNVFIDIMCNKDMLIIVGKVFKKCSLQSRLRHSLFYYNFKNEFVMLRMFQ